MDIDYMRLPPCSKKFFERVVMAFPPLSPLDIKEGTPMITIQRNAAQQEVIEYIRQAVVNDPDAEEARSLWERFKYVFKQ
jgi:hypothetical protein